MIADRAELVQTFKSAYGRLCLLAARALANGHGQTNVTEAAHGKGNLVAPVYVDLRQQRQRMNDALDACCRAGIATRHLVNAGLEVKLAIEQEWELKIPMLSQAARA